MWSTDKPSNPLSQVYLKYVTVFPAYAFFWEAESLLAVHVFYTFALVCQTSFWRWVPTPNTGTYVITFNLQVSAEKTEALHKWALKQVGHDRTWKWTSAFERHYSSFIKAQLVQKILPYIRLSDYHPSHTEYLQKRSNVGIYAGYKLNYELLTSSWPSRKRPLWTDYQSIISCGML